MNTAVKFCGVCSADDARAAADAGADYVGVILAPGYRRSQTVESAQRILDGCTATRVGVFIDPHIDDIVDAARTLDLGVIQLHGDEDVGTVMSLRRAATAAGVRFRIWKTLHVSDGVSLTPAWQVWSDAADGLLLDGGTAHARGGAGRAFDWELIANDCEDSARPFELIAAGGLNPGNVAAAIELLRPDIVDVSSGIEDATGAKSRNLMNAFVAAVSARPLMEHG